MAARRIRSSLLSILVAALVVACLPVAPSPPPPATPTPRGAIVAAATLPGQPVVQVDTTGAAYATSSNPLYVNPLALNSSADSVSIESTRLTYESNFALSPAVTASKDFIILTSSATLTVRLVYAAIWCTATTGTETAIALTQRSTAATGGTFTTPGLNARSQANAVATSSLAAYTVVPTTNGTSAGTVDVQLGFCQTASSPQTTAVTPFVFDYTKGLQQPPILRANSQGPSTDALGFFFPATAPTGVAFSEVVLIVTESTN